MNDKKGFRIWEIQENEVPKEISSSDVIKEIDLGIPLDLENKTYAIRIGKNGLK